MHNMLKLMSHYKRNVQYLKYIAYDKKCIVIKVFYFNIQYNITIHEIFGGKKILVQFFPLKKIFLQLKYSLKIS